MRTGLTVGFDLVSGGVTEAVGWARRWQEGRPDLWLTVPLDAAEVAALEPGLVTVEVPVAKLPSLGRALAERGVRVVVAGLGTSAIDLDALVDVHPAAVKVSVQRRALGPAVALGLAVCGKVIVTDVDSPELLADARNVGATAVQGAQLSAPLTGIDAVLAHLAEEETALASRG
ncbi:MAG: hypothetical protein JWN67_2690 [Actinomycetia bacterium]|nr:hypothetical protein [Actinomycetes bacterium]